MKRLVFDEKYITNFEKAEVDFATKAEIAYIVGKERLDDDFLKFVYEETYYDGITAFGVLVRYLYERFCECGNGDVYNFLTEDFGVLFEDFKNECFVEVD